MRLYLNVTGRHGDLSGFWKLSPAELMEWSSVFSDSTRQPDGFEDMEIGEEVED